MNHKSQIINGESQIIRDMRPNFKNIDIKNAGFAATNAAEWAKANGIEANWKTPEHIEVKPDRKSTRLNSSHRSLSRMPSSA